VDVHGWAWVGVGGHGCAWVGVDGPGRPWVGVGGCVWVSVGVRPAVPEANNFVIEFFREYLALCQNFDLIFFENL
jgi:hypothetical protein